jgi:hypothetical protein
MTQCRPVCHSIRRETNSIVLFDINPNQQDSYITYFDEFIMLSSRISCLIFALVIIFILY